MAKNASLFTTLFLFNFFLYFESSTSQNKSVTTAITAATATMVFDVSSSIQKTIDIFHKETRISNTITKTNTNTNDNKNANSNATIFSLSLHSRASLEDYSRYNDYESLILSRLIRDSSRVNSILLSLDQSSAATSSSSSNSLSAPVTSGESQGSGEYFARIGIGEPLQNYYWVIDTGSDVSWLQCLPCLSCYVQSDPIYNPYISSTYNKLSCDSARCQALDDSGCLADTCQYIVSYGDGSFTMGEFAMEKLSFGSSESVSDISVGCGHTNVGLFVGAAGLIGLGGGSLSLPSQLKVTSFSYCLVDSDSNLSSTLDFNYYSGGNNNDSIVVTTALVRNTRYYTYRYIKLIGMSVGAKVLHISPSLFAIDDSGSGGTILDSGTSVTRLRTKVYEALRDEFVRQGSNLPRSTSGYSLFDTCYDLSSKNTNTSTLSIPTVSFNFARGQILTLLPESVLVAVDSEGKFCLAFAPTNTTLSIIGNIQQQRTRVNFDLANSVVEFSPKSC